MASSNEYTEGYGRIDINGKQIRDILFNHAKDNKGDDNFGIFPENTILNENKQIFIKNYETLIDLFKKNNPYLIHVIENAYSEVRQESGFSGNNPTFDYVEIIFIDNYCNYYIIKGYKNGVGRFSNGYMCQKKTSPDKFIIKKQSTHKLSNDLIDDIKKIKPIQNINFKDDGILKFIENNPLYDIINIYFKLHQKNKTLEAVKDLPEINEDSEESDEIDKLWFDGKILNKVITNYGKPSTTEEHKNIIEKYNK